ncbi:MAG TPA: M24 family metallopeptidase [Dehalococcoidales bacterium]|nr:M24 family metallopeptidase [Dehalococcoidales bacterium]
MGTENVFELSINEKNRRWNLLRERLKKAGLEALVVYGGSQLGVPVHYLTCVWGARNNMLIFPVEGHPILLIPSNSGQTPERTAAQGCWINPEHIRLSANLAVDAARIISSLGLQNSRIGIDSFRWWPVYDYQLFSSLCPGVEVVESHRLFGEVRGPKSPEELTLMKKAIQISDMAHYTFLANLKPGMTEEEAVRYAVEVLDTHGIGDRIVLIHSRPEAVYLNRPGKSVIQRPHPVTFSPEFTRNLGYGAQMIRAYWWEKPEGIYKKMFELWADMRQMIEVEFRPGVEIEAAGKKIEDLVASYGFECDKLGHAVGLSYGESPYITGGPEEKDYMEWTILAGEVYAVHPMVRCPGYVAPWSMIGDMYFVGEDRTTRMTTTLPGLPEYIL